MTQKLTAISGAVLLLLLPLVTFAQEEGAVEGGADDAGLSGAVENIASIVDSLIPLLLTLAVVIFIWGLVKYIFKIGGEEGSKGGMQIMIWGVVALFVMVSIWGLVSLLQNTLNVESANGSSVANPDNLSVIGDGAGE